MRDIFHQQGRNNTKNFVLLCQIAFLLPKLWKNMTSFIHCSHFTLQVPDLANSQSLPNQKCTIENLLGWEKWHDTVCRPKKVVVLYYATENGHPSWEFSGYPQSVEPIVKPDMDIIIITEMFLFGWPHSTCPPRNTAGQLDCAAKSLRARLNELGCGPASNDWKWRCSSCKWRQKESWRI